MFVDFFVIFYMKIFWELTTNLGACGNYREMYKKNTYNWFYPTSYTYLSTFN